MIRFLLAAPRSGSGKTTMACALLASLKRQGRTPCAFKCGPDYIDPMFHRAVLGVECHNLDLFFSSPETVRTLYAQGAAGLGASKEEIMQAAMLAISMGGSPKMMYMKYLFEELDDLY